LHSNYHSGVNILAIETSTEACSAALLREDGAIFSEFEIAPRQHTRLLPAMLDAVLAAADIPKNSITHCAFANGPGAFTGIRIAASQAQGIGIALDIPLLPISTLAVLAQASLDKFAGSKTLVALDARMAEVYWATYARDPQGCARLVGREALTAVDAVDIRADIDCAAGHGWAVGGLSAAVNDRFPVDADLLPDASSLLILARVAVRRNQGVAAERISINYLRNRVAEKAKA
jgi:tRNA threonylcarbamoyladenosine biosynthesis protein TsaB